MLLKLARRHFHGFIVLHACGLGLSEKKIEVQWANKSGADAVASLPPIYPADWSRRWWPLTRQTDSPTAT